MPIELSTAEQHLYDTYTERRVCAPDGPEDCEIHSTWLRVGVQQFHIGHESYESAEEADWMRAMLAKALAQLMAAEALAPPRLLCYNNNINRRQGAIVTPDLSHAPALSLSAFPAAMHAHPDTGLPADLVARIKACAQADGVMDVVESGTDFYGRSYRRDPYSIPATEQAYLVEISRIAEWAPGPFELKVLPPRNAPKDLGQ